MLKPHTRVKHVIGVLALTLTLLGCPGTGPLGLSVPSVVGLAQANGEWTLLFMGLRVGAVTEAYSATVAEGAIAEQDPPAAQRVQRGAAVDLVVSMGPAPDLAVDSTAVALGADAPSATVTVTNDGVAALSWTATSSDPGVTVTPASGAGDSTDVTIAADLTDTYSAEVTFVRDDDAADSATVTVEVTREVIPNLLISVPAGSFEMGDPWAEGGADELPVHTVTLSAYEIGEHEVTRQEYVDMLNWAQVKGYISARYNGGNGPGLLISAHGGFFGELDEHIGIGYASYRFFLREVDGVWVGDHPIRGIRWYGAAAYCNWLSEKEGLELCYDTSTSGWPCDLSKNGYHLPTEAQWERAAAWDNGYHWRYGCSADAIDCSLVNCADAGALCNPLGLPWVFTWPVGGIRVDGIGAQDRVSPVGCLDMSGNVVEWCNDWWDADYYASSPAVDPEGPASGDGRVLRGGHLESWRPNCRTAKRFSGAPSQLCGFRIAR